MSELKIRGHRDVILHPIVNEKNYSLLDKSKYTFIVTPHVNKTKIKIAIEKIFDVHVIAVDTQNRQGRRRRARFGIDEGVDVKYAIVTVVGGDRIDIFTGQGE